MLKLQQVRKMTGFISGRMTSLVLLGIPCLREYIHQLGHPVGDQGSD